MLGKIALYAMTILMFSLGVLAEEALSHEASQGSAPFSDWKKVTWNPEYRLVHHKHVSDGTVCEYVKAGERKEDAERNKLAALNGTNRSCVPSDREG